MAETNVTVAERPNPFATLRAQLEQRAGDLQNALPTTIEVKRFIRNAMTAAQKNPGILEAYRPSVITALLQAASDGLMPDGKEGVILCYHDNNQNSPTKGMMVAQWQPMVAGLLKRFRNSGQFKSISADVVREGESFKHWVDELGEHLYHEPGDGTGKVVKTYAMALTKDGGCMIKVMSTNDIERRRAVSKAKNGGMWRDWWDEAAIKTVLRNLSKRLPSSSDIDELMRRDDDEEDFKPQLPVDRPERPGIASALDQFAGDPAAGDAAAGVLLQNLPPQEGDAREPEDAPAEATQSAEAPELTTARERGAEARRNKVLRRAIPPEYREKGREVEAAHWHEGWDNAE